MVMRLKWMDSDKSHIHMIFGSHLSLFNIFQSDQTLFSFNAIEMDLLVTLMYSHLNESTAHISF